LEPRAYFGDWGLNLLTEDAKWVRDPNWRPIPVFQRLLVPFDRTRPYNGVSESVGFCEKLVIGPFLLTVDALQNKPSESPRNLRIRSNNIPERPDEGLLLAYD
jgi:hypothetical protein